MALPISTQEPTELCLPNPGPSQYKVLTFVYKCLREKAAHFLNTIIEVKNTGRVTRSYCSDMMDLAVPKVCSSTFAGRTFSIKGPNCGACTLPTNIRDCDSHEILKTFKL